MIRKLNVDFYHVDERGIICQILSIPSLQINYLFTKKGAKRGRHYHKENREIFYVIGGKVKISAWHVNNDQEREERVFETGESFLIEPFAVHDLEFIEDTQMVAIYDKGVQKGEKKDIYAI